MLYLLRTCLASSQFDTFDLGFSNCYKIYLSFPDELGFCIHILIWSKPVPLLPRSCGADSIVKTREKKMSCNIYSSYVLSSTSNSCQNQCLKLVNKIKYQSSIGVQHASNGTKLNNMIISVLIIISNIFQ